MVVSLSVGVVSDSHRRAALGVGTLRRLQSLDVIFGIGIGMGVVGVGRSSVERVSTQSTLARSCTYLVPIN